MNRWFMTLLASLGLVLVISGCSAKKEEPAKNPKDAMYDFLNSEIDALLFNNYLIVKR